MRRALAAACVLGAIVAGRPVCAEDAVGEIKPVVDFGSPGASFSLRLMTAIQFRYTYVWYDDAVRGNETDYSNFYMRRARLWWTGHAFDPRFRYFFHIQLEPTRTVNAHDLWLEYAFSDLLKLGLGRMKIAYGLEFLNSGFYLNMVERSVMYGETDIDLGGGGPSYPGGGTERFGLTWFDPDTGFATGGLGLYRSQGVQLYGERAVPGGFSWDYQVGLWQGRSTLGLSNTGHDHLVAVRAGVYPRGTIDWRYQGDGDPTEYWRWGVIGSVYTTSGRAGGGYDEGGWNLAMLHRFRGLSLDLEWGTESWDYDRFADDLDRRGWRAHAGWFVVPSRLELVARWAAIERLTDPTYRKAIDSGLGVAEVRDGDGWSETLEARISELTVGASLYLNNWHRHKVIVDASRLERTFAADPAAGIERAPEQVDWRVRAMVQLGF